MGLGILGLFMSRTTDSSNAPETPKVQYQAKRNNWGETGLPLPNPAMTVFSCMYVSVAID